MKRVKGSLEILENAEGKTLPQTKNKNSKLESKLFAEHYRVPGKGAPCHPLTTKKGRELFIFGGRPGGKKKNYSGSEKRFAGKKKGLVASNCQRKYFIRNISATQAGGGGSAKWVSGGTHTVKTVYRYKTIINLSALKAPGRKEA